ncbi:MAG: hypothetical protein NUV56_01850, partial [Candidatus Uhrbacteria bacterium]|nr:hypothetical protein [Candidatus Uhrbacteria bacterium]
PFWQIEPVILALILCYGLQRFTLTPLRIHLPTYLIAAYLPLVGMLTFGIVKDFADSMTSPYPTNTGLFILSMTQLIIVATLTLFTQNITRERAAQFFAKHRTSYRYLGFAPAAYFLGTAITLAFDPNRMNAIDDTPLYIFRVFFDAVFFSIIGLLRFPYAGSRLIAEIIAVTLVFIVLIMALWKLIRIYRREHRIPMFEANLICYLISFLCMVASVY